MTTTELSNDLLKLHGLKAIAADLTQQLDAVHSAVCSITGESPDDGSWSSDFVWAGNDITPEELMEHTAGSRETR